MGPVGCCAWDFLLREPVVGSQVRIESEHCVHVVNLVPEDWVRVAFPHEKPYWALRPDTVFALQADTPCQGQPPPGFGRVSRR